MKSTAKKVLCIALVLTLALSTNGSIVAGANSGGGGYRIVATSQTIGNGKTTCTKICTMTMQ